MHRYRYALFLLGLFLILGGLVASQKAAETTPAYITAAIQAPVRTRTLMARDADRKPAEVLAFTGIKPGEKLAMFLPDRYYASLLSKVVGFNGEVYALEPFHGSPHGGAVNNLMVNAKKAEKLGQPYPVNYIPYSDLEPLQHTVVFRNMRFIFANMNEYNYIFPVPEQLDAVFTSERYHEMHNTVDVWNTDKSAGNKEPYDMVAQNKGIFRALKPGGVYIVSDYNAAKGAGFSQSQALNRVEADAVKQEVLAAGFEFVGESKILANPNDDRTKAAYMPPKADGCAGPSPIPSNIEGQTTTCPKGIPQHVPNGDKADQFLMKFRKPASASAKTGRPENPYKNFVGNTRANGTPQQRGNVFFFLPDPLVGVNKGGDVEIMDSLGDNPEYEFVYLDADGNYCNYHEIPQDGFTPCYDRPPEQANAKVGECWKIHNSDQTSCLVPGYEFPNTDSMMGGGAQPAKQPAKGAGGDQPAKQPGKRGGGGADSGGM